MRFAIMALALMLCACAERAQTLPQKPADCDSLYVILPGNFIIDLAADADVILNPGVQRFTLFCSPGEAAGALQAGVENGALPPSGDWQVYRMRGAFSEIASYCDDGGYCLDRPALVQEWINPDGN